MYTLKSGPAEDLLGYYQMGVSDSIEAAHKVIKKEIINNGLHLSYRPGKQRRRSRLAAGMHSKMKEESCQPNE